MMMKHHLLLSSLMVLTAAIVSCTGQAPPANKEFLSVSDIGDAMYHDQKYFGGCYKLLNSTGPIGCAAPSSSRVHARLVKLQDLPSPITGAWAVLVPSQAAHTFLQQLQLDGQLQQHVKVVLVYEDVVPASSSAAQPFPGGAQYAPYSAPGAASSYVWNPHGDSTALAYIPVPAFHITPTLASDSLWRADYNARNDFKGSGHWVEAELTMEATQRTSAECLQAGTCWPLGGFNVWSAMPPLPPNTTSGLPQPSGKSITLVAAGIDSNAVFHDSVQGADAPLSGLVAMLAAMRILNQAGQAPTYTRQLVFTAFAGEPWGYMGSKRLLWDLARGGNAYTAGLRLEDIDQVIELGQIGRALNASTNISSLYLHSQPAGGAWGDASQLLTTIQGAAAANADAKLSVSPASSSNPGVPPSSLFTFLRAKPSIAGVVITEFDREFTNPYYHSSYDDASRIDVEPLVAGAALLARTLHALAAPAGAPALQVNVSDVKDTVLAMAACLMFDDPGMSCPLAQPLLNADYQVTDQYVSYAVKHYLGVLQYIHPNPQDPFYKKTIYRFLWNYMGLLSAVGTAGSECAFAASQCAPGLECIGWRGSNKKNKQLMGRCYNTTVRYVPALSTSIDYTPSDVGAIGLSLSNASAAWEAAGGWPPDPLWTESNWPMTTPFVRVYQRESAASEWAVFGGGIAVCVFTGVATWWGRAQYEKHLKPH